jgi:outer membrane lipoprotein SlyB
VTDNAANDLITTMSKDEKPNKEMDMKSTLTTLSLAASIALALSGTALAQQQPLPGTPAAPTAAAAVCETCGVVESVTYQEKKGEASGAGLVVGGVAGGVIGHQIGSGRGNTVATIAGAGLGALAGNQVEKNVKKKTYYVVTVSLDNGKKKSITYSSQPAFKQGDRVKVIDGKKLALLAN